MVAPDRAIAEGGGNKQGGCGYAGAARQRQMRDARAPAVGQPAITVKECETAFAAAGMLGLGACATRLVNRRATPTCS